jgi:hypothetical protein
MNKTINIKTSTLFLIAITIVILTCSSIHFIIRPTNRVIYTWKQTNDLSYKVPPPYYLSVVENDLDMSRFPGSFARRYYIYVGKDEGKPVYGYTIDHSFHEDINHINNIEGYIKESKVSWTEQGVEFEEKSGNKVFIPKEFINER